MTTLPPDALKIPPSVLNLCSTELESYQNLKQFPLGVNHCLLIKNYALILEEIPETKRDSQSLKSRLLYFFHYEYQSTEEISCFIESFNDDYCGTLKLQLDKRKYIKIPHCSACPGTDKPVDIHFTVKLFFLRGKRELELVHPLALQETTLPAYSAIGKEVQIKKVNSSGLINHGNICFYNSAVQIFKIICDEITPFQNSIKYIPLTMAISIASKAIPENNGHPSEKRHTNVHALAAKLSVIPFTEKITTTFWNEELTHFSDVDKAKLTELIIAFFNFRDATKDLFNALNTPLSPQKNSSLHSAFHQAFVCLAVRLERENLLRLLNVTTPTTSRMSDISKQGDCDEALQFLIELSGLDASPRLCLLQTDTVKVLKNVETGKPKLLETIAPIPSKLPIFKLSTYAVDGTSTEYTFQQYFTKFTKVEKLDKENSWDYLEKLDKYKDKGSDYAIVQKQLKYVTPSSEYPSHLLIDLKPVNFRNETEKPTTTLRINDRNKTVSIQTASLYDTVVNNLTIQVPICQSTQEEAQQVDFVLKAVACHPGPGAKSGHYYVLKFEDNGTVTEINDKTVSSEYNYKTNPEKFKRWLIKQNVGGAIYLFKRKTLIQQPST